MQDECTRIARAYDEHEQKALQYVLSEFFTLENGAFRHNRCEKEIAEFRVRSEKRSRAAKARWSKSGKGSDGIHEDSGTSIEHSSGYARAHANAVADAKQMECQPLTVNRKPIKEEGEGEGASASPAETDGLTEKTKKRSRRRPSIACPWSADDEVPEDLAAWAKEKHPSVDCSKEFEKLVHWAQSHDERRPDWPATFRGWIARAEGYEKERQRRGAYQHSPLSEQDYTSYDELWGRTGIVEG
jgi:uncharacterized protein YdaU (DUF1376 family)